MKIDIHTHILPRTWPDLDKKFGYPGFVRLEHCDECSARMMIGDRFFREIKDNVWEPKRRIEEMDRSGVAMRSEEHTSELQSRVDLVCRLLLEKKKKKQNTDKKRT